MSHNIAPIFSKLLITMRAARLSNLLLKIIRTGTSDSNSDSTINKCQ